MPLLGQDKQVALQLMLQILSYLSALDILFISCVQTRLQGHCSPDFRPACGCGCGGERERERVRERDGVSALSAKFNWIRITLLTDGGWVSKGNAE